MSGPAEMAALLVLSSERDKWVLVCLQRERTAFARGRALGDVEGYARACAEMAQRWTRIAHPVTHGGPGYAELEERRWGPGGRARFGDPRPGDFPGRNGARAA